MIREGVSECPRELPPFFDLPERGETPNENPQNRQ